MRRVRTADGSTTFISERYGEPYHSITAGAFTESVEKFCKPCGVSELARSGRVNLLDVCFGLGYNSVALIDEALRSNPDVRIFILAVERDVDVTREGLSLDWGHYGRYKPILRSLLSSFYVFKGFPNFIYEDGRLGIRLVAGESRKVLRAFSPDYSNFFNAVFHDPFSPKVNPEMWTLEVFRLISGMMEKGARLSTYSSSSAVRKALFMSGFSVYKGVRLGRKSYSTVAVKGDCPSVSAEIREKVERAVPYRDPALSDAPRLIASRRDGCIYILSKAYQPECLSLN